MYSRQQLHLYTMQRILFLFSSVLVLISTLGITQLFAQTIVSSKVEAVTVYQQGALVTRKGSVKLDAGEQQLRFSNLEQSIRSGSLQLDIDPSVGTFAIEFGFDASRKTQEPDSLLQLRDSLTVVRLALSRLAAKRAGYIEELAVIAANRDLSSDQAATSQSPEKIRDAAKIYREMSTAANLALVDIDVEEKRLKMLEARTVRRIESIRPAPRQDIGVVNAKVVAERAGTFDFELTYIVESTSWSPNYDLYVTTEGKANSQLVLAANVQQTTGVDWNNVKLTLSTGDINSRLAPPQLAPYYIGYPQPVAMARNQAQVESDMVFEAPMSNTGYAPKRQATYGTELSSASAQLYAINRPFSLATNGKASSVKLIAHDLPIHLRYRVVPKREQRAYLEGLITDWDELNLVAAQTRMHLDGRYLGEIYLDVQQNSDTLTFGLGPDERLVVERTGKGQGSDTKFIRGRKVYNLGYVISLRNTRNVAIDVLVEDQVPVSQRDEITVEIKERSGKPSFDASTGILSWQLSLKPASREELKVAYTIDAPKDTPIRFE